MAEQWPRLEGTSVADPLRTLGGSGHVGARTLRWVGCLQSTSHGAALGEVAEHGDKVGEVGAMRRV